MELISIMEFRIGNYYNRMGIKGFEHEKMSLNLLSRIMSDDMSIAFNDFEGIDLSEQWILNLGFKKTTNNEKSGPEVTMSIDEGLFSILESKPESNSWIFKVGDLKIRAIKYVHDFQNIYFALSKKELFLSH